MGGLVVEAVDADVKLDEVFVAQNLLCEAFLGPGQWRIEVVCHVGLKFRSALQKVEINDLADAHSAPDV